MRKQLLDDFYNSTEYRDKVKERFEVLMMCDKDPLKIIELTVDRWAINPIAFIEQFGYIFNPKYGNATKPFFLFEYQKKIITRLWEAELSGEEVELLIDKPREMGLTWVIAWYYIWRWLFTKTWSGAILSRVEDEVDNGSSDPSFGIFPKIRWGIQHLPEWLTPKGFVPKGKKGNNTDMALRISNPQMSSTIVGSSANDNAFRGSRFSMSWVDECFFIKNFWPAHRSIAHISNVRVYVSTSKLGRTFQKYVDEREAAGCRIQLTYQDNPFKDKEWFDQKMAEAEVDPEAMKEIMVSYAVNSTMQYYPELSLAKVATVNYNRKLPYFISLDYGRQDHTVLVYWQFDGANFNIIECVARNQKDFDWFCPFMNKDLTYDESAYLGAMKEKLDKIRSWEKPKAVFGETAHKQVHYPSNSSIQRELIKYGIKLLTNDNAIQYEVRRKAGSAILPRCVFNQDSDEVMELYDALLNSRYAGNAKGVSKEALMKPAHDDEVGDYRSAFENGACNLPRILRSQREDVDPSLKHGENSIIGLIKFLRI
jgi:hypothetical protein